MGKLSPLASPAATRAVLEEHGLATKKALGQHFLISDGIVARICAVAALSPADVVLEVGPGIGTLTVALLQKAAFVIAVERDGDLMAVLADTCAQHRERLALINKDALGLTEADLSGAAAGERPSGKAPAGKPSNAPRLPNKLVSNLPYAVAATLVLGFFQRFPSLESATVMVQGEVADRMCAKPGTKAYGAYTVKLSLFARPVERFTVGPGNFFPPPRVESAVLRLDRGTPLDPSGRPLAPEAIEASCVMADAAFANRRKTILNSCKSYFGLLEEKGAPLGKALPSLEQVLEEAGVDPRLRGEALDTQDFIRLGQSLRALSPLMLA